MQPVTGAVGQAGAPTGAGRLARRIRPARAGTELTLTEATVTRPPRTRPPGTRAIFA